MCNKLRVQQEMLHSPLVSWCPRIAPGTRVCPRLPPARARGSEVTACAPFLGEYFSPSYSQQDQGESQHLGEEGWEMTHVLPGTP